MGRPEFKPSLDQRQTVERMKYFGEPETVIARALRIDVNTLRKHFADELADGYASRRKEVVDLLFDSARDGNVSARKRLEEIGRVSGAAAEFESRQEPSPPKLGKKDEATIAAQTAGTGSDWGDDLIAPGQRPN